MADAYESTEMTQELVSKLPNIKDGENLRTALLKEEVSADASLSNPDIVDKAPKTQEKDTQVQDSPDGKPKKSVGDAIKGMVKEMKDMRNSLTTAISEANDKHDQDVSVIVKDLREIGTGLKKVEQETAKVKAEMETVKAENGGCQECKSNALAISDLQAEISVIAQSVKRMESAQSEIVQAATNLRKVAEEVTEGVRAIRECEKLMRELKGGSFDAKTFTPSKPYRPPAWDTKYPPQKFTDSLKKQNRVSHMHVAMGYTQEKVSEYNDEEEDDLQQRDDEKSEEEGSSSEEEEEDESETRMSSYDEVIAKLRDMYKGGELEGKLREFEDFMDEGNAAEDFL